MTDTPSDLGLILKAAQFAATRHRDQRRKDPEASPYINHPIALANILCNEGGVTDATTIAAALLHDTVEDTKTSPEEIVKYFGTDIAGIVSEVTDDKSLEKADRKRLQIEHAPHLSARAKLVKLADKISNLRDVAGSPPTNWTLERRRQYFDWAKRVVDGLGEVNPELQVKFEEAFSRHP